MRNHWDTFKSVWSAHSCPTGRPMRGAWSHIEGCLVRMDMTEQTFSCSRPRECDIASHSRDGLACDLMGEIEAIWWHLLPAIRLTHHISAHHVYHLLPSGWRGDLSLLTKGSPFTWAFDPISSSLFRNLLLSSRDTKDRAVGVGHPSAGSEGCSIYRNFKSSNKTNKKVGRLFLITMDSNSKCCK